MFERVRAAVLTGFPEVARFVGLDPWEQLRLSNINPNELKDYENWLPASPVGELLERCATQSGRTDFALLMAECRKFSSLGPVSLLVKHEATLGSIICRLKEFRRHLNDLVDVHLEQSDDVAALHWTVAPSFFSQQIILLVAAMGYRVTTEAMHGRWLPATAYFPFPAPIDTSLYRRFFLCDLHFDSDFCGLSFPVRELQLANPQADGLWAEHAAALLKLLPPPRSTVADEARHVLLLLVPNGTGALDAVARNMSISPRKLQRELTDEGITFADLLNDVRRALAIHYLATPNRSIAEIADLTGYSSTSAFSRWFTSQFQASPAAWRSSEKPPLP